MNTTQEFKQLIKQLPPAELDKLKETMNILLQQQKVEEAEKYKSLSLSPFEITDIISKSEGPNVLMIDFGIDCLKYYKPHVMDFDPYARRLFTIAFLVEAGRIMGIRQERARRKERRHERT